MAREKSTTRKKLPGQYPIRRIQIGLIVAVGGFIILLIGARPELFLLDRSPVLGFIQIGVILFGLGLICLGGYVALNSLWKGNQLSIAAELGVRFVSTGYVIAVFTGLADIIGLGSHPTPDFIPYFGEWQARGVQIAEGFIAVGLLMMIPYSQTPFFRSQALNGAEKDQA